MNKKAYSYVVFVTVLAGTIAFVADWSSLASLSSRHLIGLGALIGLSIISEALAVHISVIDSKRAIRTSLGFLPLLTCAVVFPPEAAILASAVTELFAE